MSTLLTGGGGPLLTAELLKLIVRLLKKLPKLALRFVLTALSPGAHFKRLALVTALQALASLVHYARKLWARGSSVAWQRLAKARNYDEYSVAAREVESDAPPAGDALSGPQESFFATLRERAANYARLQAEGDEYGLMFHLRSELMRQQLGNRGYAREGSKWLREHSTAREAIAHYQAHVCEALRYIASGAAPSSSAARQRLAFVNETRHSYGQHRPPPPGSAVPLLWLTPLLLRRPHRPATLGRRRVRRQAHRRRDGAAQREPDAPHPLWHIGRLDRRCVLRHKDGRRAAGDAV